MLSPLFEYGLTRERCTHMHMHCALSMTATNTCVHVYTSAAASARGGIEYKTSRNAFYANPTQTIVIFAMIKLDIIIIKHSRAAVLKIVWFASDIYEMLQPKWDCRIQSKKGDMGTETLITMGFYGTNSYSAS